MSNQWLRRLLPVVIIALALLLALGLMSIKTDIPLTATLQARANVEVMTIERGPLQLTVHSQGMVTSKRRIEWASEVAGRVIWVAPELIEGAEVAADTLLLKLDSSDYRVAVAEAQASLADANLALTEERNESRRGASYRADNQQSSNTSLRQPKLAQVEARLNAAREKLLQAQQDLAAVEIKAPFAGIIDKKHVDLGQYVTTGMRLFNFLGVDVAELRLPITAAEIGFIPTSNNDYSKVLLTANFGRQQRQWEGRLVRIERRVDADTRSFFAVAEVAQPYNKDLHPVPLTVGLFVEASIAGIKLDHGVRIPSSAVHDNRYVFLVKDGRLQRQHVDVMRREMVTVVIGDGLMDGDQLVLTKLDLMVEGMPVMAPPLVKAKDKLIGRLAD